MRKLIRFPLIVALVSLCLSTALAAVKPHGMFTDNAVLQQGRKVPVWGTADDGEKVTVKICGQQACAVAKGGKWMVWLKPLKAGGPFTMTICGTNTIELKNVLVGEVWICSGQSNMQWMLISCANSADVIAASKDPLLRLIDIPRGAKDETQSELPVASPGQAAVAWRECTPDTVPSFSGVGYFFGKHLREALKVPVGLIGSNVGGTPAEAWTSRRVLEKEFPEILASHAQAIKNWPQVEANNQKIIAKAKAEKKQPPRLPQNPATSGQRPAGLYNAMIVPLEPYAIAGAIWYQGESNAGRAYQYRTLFPAMIKNWRKDWGYNFPFLFVQLAPFMKIEAEPMESNWAELREAQLLTTVKLPKTGQAVITDVGEETDIHPKQKEPVGQRLAIAAQAIAYGQKIEFSGPAYAGMKVQGNKAVLSFTHLGGGLVAKDGALKGFAISGADKKFVNAQAEIQGDKIVVCSPQVAKPAAVRYGWANFPVVNLWNKAGLPASPFRTDNWPGVTWPKPVEKKK
ncbi:MAG: sialate O-acetylesterase [Verrucomicrobia bacterium]|nr:sialate O-acetylesterase [Verrucomicrobiota bacterium]